MMNRFTQGPDQFPLDGSQGARGAPHLRTVRITRLVGTTCRAAMETEVQGAKPPPEARQRFCLRQRSPRLRIKAASHGLESTTLLVRAGRAATATCPGSQP